MRIEESFGESDEQAAWREQVRAELAGPVIGEAIAALRADPAREPDIRPVYRAVGERGLLAVDWPEKYGGRGMTAVEAAIVTEELFRAGVPDNVFVNTVQIVGRFLLLAGTPAQKERYLPAIARGEMFASILYTEPGVGSDLASLRTTAVPYGDGYRLTGTKVFTLKGHLTHIALCAARTGEEGSRYEGITLFLLDMRDEGIRRSVIPSIGPEDFSRLELHGVVAGPGSVVGAVNDGWALLGKALPIERTGLDYALRAERWHAAAAGRVAAGPASVRDAYARYGAQVSAGLLLARRMTDKLARGEVDEAAFAAAKYYTSELSVEVARWAALLPGPDDEVLDAAYREAPASTVSAGVSEVMLQIVSGTVLEEGYQPDDPEDDETARRLRAAVRAVLASVPVPDDPHAPPADHGAGAPAWVALLGIEAPALEVPAEANGLGLGLTCGVVLTEELGRAGLGSPYPAVALVLQALTHDDPRLADLLAGRTVAAAAGPGTPPAVLQDAADGWRLKGEFAATSADADLLAIPVRADGVPRLALLPADRCSGSRPLPYGGALLRFDDAAVRPYDLTAPLDPDGAVVAAARIRQAAYLVGLAQGAHAEAVRYVGRRRQFGRLLREFQSVAFTLARVHAELTALRLLIHRTARLVDEGRPAGPEAAAALALAAETASTTLRDTMHLAGSRGLTAHTQLQRYYRMVQAEAVRLGGPAALWAETAARERWGR